MNLKHAALSAMIGALATTAFADVDWMILPKYSTSGRMLIQGTRDATGKKGKPAGRIVPGMRLETPQTNKLNKYKYLRIGGMGGNFCFCDMNEKGLAVIFTGGDPTRDKNPAKMDGNTHRPNTATVVMLRSCATAQQAVRHMQDAFKKRIIANSAIFFIADPNRAFVIECSPRHFASWELPHAFCVYSNCWKLPGMDDGSLGTADRAATNYQREWAAREALKQAFDSKKEISVADSIRASRVTVAEANGEEFAKRRGKGKVSTAPFNKNSADSYLFDLDSEFPAELRCVYAALGPQRHTVYLPIPMGAADKLPAKIASKEWSNHAYRLRDAADPEAPMRPELVEFEQKQLQEFAKVRKQARGLLRQDKRDEALQLLRDNLAKQARETFEFLSTLK